MGELVRLVGIGSGSITGLLQGCLQAEGVSGQVLQQVGVVCTGSWEEVYKSSALKEVADI